MKPQPKQVTAPAQLRHLLEKRCAVATPGCHDPLGAMLIAEAGFEAMSMSGYSFAASLAKPDIGLISSTQMTEQSTTIAQTVALPLLADADTGYGGISNIAETVRAYERGGVAGLHLEDQVNPKRCGAMASKVLASDEEMRHRIRAAIAARNELLIVGRTDALSIAGLDEAIRRCKLMADAGADAVMVPSLSSLEDIEKVVRASPVPVVHTVAETVRPLFTQVQLAGTGLGMAMYPITLIQAITQLQRTILSELKTTGTTTRFVESMIPLPQLSALLGASRYEAFESSILDRKE